jgi:hypothetical protein
MRDLHQQVAQPQDHPTTSIYGLVDPTTGYVRYVGKSVDTNFRLRRHLSKVGLKEKTHKANWLNSLVAKGLKPDIILLENTSTSNWQRAEKKWIAYYRNLPGYPPLTNGTSGGDGTDKGEKRRPRTPEERRMSSVLVKNAWANYSPEKRKALIDNLKFGRGPEKSKRVAIIIRRRPKIGNLSSRFLGVSWRPDRNIWRAYVTKDRKTIHLGYFEEENEAARARDRKIIEMFGDFVRLNFPRSDYG